MEAPATQRDLNALRGEITTQIDKLWADHRDTAREHAREDDQRFADLTSKIEEINRVMALATGMFSLAKWTLGLGIPAILAALITHVVRHWNP